MSSVLSEYPETLPAPMVGVVTPTERRKVGSIGGVQSFRTVQRDRHGARTYAFTFTKEQAAIFRDWWAEWEQRGGGWFAANWPLPWSRGPNVFRFKNPPEWSLIGGGIDGQGYWRVSGALEIRGRGMLPTIDVMYLTSTPYPIAYIDGIGMDGGGVKELPVIRGYLDAFSIGGMVISASSRDIYQKYSLPPEGFSIEGSVVSISSIGTIYTTINAPTDSISIDAIVYSMSSRIGLITYSNYRPEGLSISASVIGITSSGS